MRRILRVVAVLATIGAVVVVMARVLARRQQPPAPAPTDWPPLARERPADTPTPAAPEPKAAPAATAEPEPEAAAETATDGWVDADDGSCPTSHPVKAKLSSGIYHVPGGLNYERTKADRCYASPDAAEGDGLRASKR